MYLVHFETVLDFFKDTRVITPAKAIFEALTGKPIVKKELKEPGVLIRDATNKHAVRWDYNDCSMLYEDMSNHEHCIKNTIMVLDKINSVAPIGKLERTKLTLFWILPVEKYTLETLELKYRNSLIKPTDIFVHSIDSSVVIDIKCDKGILHHQSGPMGISQFREEYRVFPAKEKQPRLFLFLETSIINEELVQYSSKEMTVFLFDSFEICKHHSTSFQKTMEAIL